LLSEYKKALLNLIVQCHDNLGEKSLNETEADGMGIRSNAKYYMQIFDTVKGHSK
jgi:hypothetical protein